MEAYINFACFCDKPSEDPLNQQLVCNGKRNSASLACVKMASVMADSLRTCCTSCPEVVSSTHAHNPGLWHLDLISPQGVSFSVLFVHTHPYALGQQLERLCDNLQRPL